MLTDELIKKIISEEFLLEYSYKTNEWSSTWKEASDILDKKILSKGIFLGDYGINNWGFTQKKALNVLKELEKYKAIILGGDVFFKKDNGVEPTYDNWDFKKHENETEIEFSNRTIKSTKKYIKQYKTTSNKIIFILDAQ